MTRSATSAERPKGAFLAADASDEAIAAGIRAGQASAKALMFDRYAAHVRRLLARVLGGDPEIADLVQHVFLEALSSIHTLDDDRRLGGWISSITIFTAKRHLRSKRRRAWLRFFAPAEIPETPSHLDPADDARAALDATYTILRAMPDEERIVFALRFIEGMELTEVAAAADMSMSTLKRRLEKARGRFERQARKHPVLLEWMQSGGGQ
jgi:RNA polymerase sigma-70 factor, ECF subfamily